MSVEFEKAFLIKVQGVAYQLKVKIIFIEERRARKLLVPLESFDVCLELSDESDSEGVILGDLKVFLGFLKV